MTSSYKQSEGYILRNMKISSHDLITSINLNSTRALVFSQDSQWYRLCNPRSNFFSGLLSSTRWL
jgi:hypothetical protein